MTEKQGEGSPTSSCGAAESEGGAASSQDVVTYSSSPVSVSPSAEAPLAPFGEEDIAEDQDVKTVFEGEIFEVKCGGWRYGWGTRALRCCTRSP